jgi:hypothetical protein
VLLVWECLQVSACAGQLVWFWLFSSGTPACCLGFSSVTLLWLLAAGIGAFWCCLHSYTATRCAWVAPFDTFKLQAPPDFAHSNCCQVLDVAGAEHVWLLSVESRTVSWTGLGSSLFMRVRAAVLCSAVLLDPVWAAVCGCHSTCLLGRQHPRAHWT